MQRGREQRRRVDVGVAVDLAEAQKLGAFEARNQAQNARLFGEFQVILKAHQVETVGAQVFLAQAARRRRGGGRCADRSGPPASWGRSAECRGRAAPALRWAGRLRNSGVSSSGMCGGNGVGAEQRVDEAVVLVAIERAVQIVVGAVDGFAVARGPEGDGRCPLYRRRRWG